MKEKKKRRYQKSQLELRTPSDRKMQSRQQIQLDLPALVAPSQAMLDLVQKMTNTNESLSQEERSIISASRVTMKSQIDAFGRIISQLKSELNRYEQALAQVQQWESELAVPLSPLRDFPPEIIRYIFSEYAALHEYTPITGECGTWTLGRVCKRWRSIACGHREIWSRISISWKDIGGIPIHTFGNRLMLIALNVDPALLLRRMIQRAGGYPLRIKWNESERDDLRMLQSPRCSENAGDVLERMKVMNAIVTLVLLTSAQWETVELDGRGTITSPLSLSRLKWDTLRKLKITHCRPEFEQEILRWIKAIPGLRDLDIMNSSGRLWWKALESLPATVSSLHLQSCESLGKIHMESTTRSYPGQHLVRMNLECGPLEYEYETSASLDVPCTMPQLSVLRLINAPKLIQVFTCPVLQKLEMDCTSRFEVTSEKKRLLVGDLMEFMGRSECTVAGFTYDWHYRYSDGDTWSLQLADILKEI